MADRHEEDLRARCASDQATTPTTEVFRPYADPNLRVVGHGGSRSWSRNVLTNMIASSALERTGAAPSDFAQQLVAQDSEL